MPVRSYQNHCGCTRQNIWKACLYVFGTRVIRGLDGLFLCVIMGTEFVDTGKSILTGKSRCGMNTPLPLWTATAVPKETRFLAGSCYLASNMANKSLSGNLFSAFWITMKATVRGGSVMRRICRAPAPPVPIPFHDLQPSTSMFKKSFKGLDSKISLVIVLN